MMVVGFRLQHLKALRVPVQQKQCAGDGLAHQDHTGFVLLECIRPPADDAARFLLRQLEPLPNAPDGFRQQQGVDLCLEAVSNSLGLMSSGQTTIPARKPSSSPSSMASSLTASLIRNSCKDCS